MTLEEIFNHGVKAATMLFHKQGTVMPMWIAETAEGDILPTIAKMETTEQKDSVAKELKKFFKEQNVVRYVSILEAWSIEPKGNGGVPPSLQLGASLASHPDRREIIAIQAEEVNKHELCGVLYILRPEYGEATLSPLKRSPHDALAEGRFVGLLS
jgi:hypothetical protein